MAGDLQFTDTAEKNVAAGGTTDGTAMQNQGGVFLVIKNLRLNQVQER